MATNTTNPRRVAIAGVSETTHFRQEHPQHSGSVDRLLRSIDQDTLEDIAYRSSALSLDARIAGRPGLEAFWAALNDSAFAEIVRRSQRTAATR